MTDKAPKEQIATDYKGMKSECNCPGCGETFEDPRILPCNHVYCIKCVLNMSRTLVDPSDPRRGTKSCCFTCDASFQLTKGSPSSLPQSEVHLALVKNYQEKRLPVSFMCDGHSEQEAIMRCLDGCGHLCKECVSAHNTAKVMKSHQIMEIDPTKFVVFESACSEHHQPFKFVCPLEEMENPFLCPSCLSEHWKPRGPHDHHTYAEGIQNMCAHLEKNKERIENMQRSIQGFEEKIKEKQNNIENYVSELKKKASREFEKARIMVSNEERRFMEKIDLFRETAQKPFAHYESCFESLKRHLEHSSTLIDESMAIFEEQKSPVKLVMAKEISDLVSNKVIPKIPDGFDKFLETTPVFVSVARDQERARSQLLNANHATFAAMNILVEEIGQSIKDMNDKSSKEGIEYEALTRQVSELQEYVNGYNLQEENKDDIGDVLTRLFISISQVNDAVYSLS